MEKLSIFWEVAILCAFMFFFFKSLIQRFYINAIVISSFYGSIASMIGQESGKVLIMLSLYGILCFLSVFIPVRKKYYRRRYSAKYIISLFIFLLIIILSVMISPAGGYEYFNNKILFGIVEIFIPVVMIILFSGRSNSDLNTFFKFFEITAILVAFLILTNASIIGFNNILSAAFIPRVATGESNVIWTGRFLSIGFLYIILKENVSYFTKAIKLIILMLAMILTGSKAVLLFPLLTLLIYVFLFNKAFKLKTKINLLAILTLVIFGFYSLLSYLNPLAVQRRFSLKSGTIETREGSIGSVLDKYIENGNYLFGNGFATSGFPIISTYNERSYPHNITVELLYEIGFIGVICYYLTTLIPLLLFYKNHRVNKEKSILASVLVLFLLYAQTSGNMVGNSFVFVFSGYLIYEMKMSEKSIRS